jgi:uncharacterized protein with HEPN domain
MNAHDRIRLVHMKEAAAVALRLARGRTREDLDRDEGLVLSLVKAVEIVGEAANKVSQPTRDRFGGIPWKPIAHMRHRLVHDYFRINLDIVWKTVQDDLVPLLTLLEEALKEDSP